MTLTTLADPIAAPRTIRIAQTAGNALMPLPGSLGDLLRLLGEHSIDLHDRDRLPITMRRVRAGTTLVREGAPLEFLYFVMHPRLTQVRKYLCEVCDAKRAYLIHSLLHGDTSSSDQ